MSNYAHVRSGDRVRVTLEGIASLDAAIHGPGISIGAHRFRPGDAATFDVVEPAWQDGDVVEDANGDLYVRDGQGWRKGGRSGEYVADDVPARRLQRHGSRR